MNLEAVCNLVKEAGLTRAIISIDTSGDEAVVLLNIPTANGATPDIDNQKEMALRAALSTPLKVMGHVAEIDSVVDQEVQNFSEGFIPANTSLAAVTSNTTTTVAKQQKATASATKNNGKSGGKNGGKANQKSDAELKSAQKPQKGEDKSTPKAPVEKAAETPEPSKASTGKPEVESASEELNNSSDNMDFFGAISL